MISYYFYMHYTLLGNYETSKEKFIHQHNSFFSVHLYWGTLAPLVATVVSLHCPKHQMKFIFGLLLVLLIPWSITLCLWSALHLSKPSLKLEWNIYESTCLLILQFAILLLSISIFSLQHAHFGIVLHDCPTFQRYHTTSIVFELVL